MNFGEIKAQVMHQTNNDADDLGDFLPALNDYVNEGYDRLAYAFAKKHLGEDEFDRLRADRQSPALPDWTHRAIADWATWLVYRNGNVQKQNRGLQYRNAFLELESRLLSMSAYEKGLVDTPGELAESKSVRKFRNIPL